MVFAVEGFFVVVVPPSFPTLLYGRSQTPSSFRLGASFDWLISTIAGAGNDSALCTQGTEKSKLFVSGTCERMCGRDKQTKGMLWFVISSDFMIPLQISITEFLEEFVKHSYIDWTWDVLGNEFCMLYNLFLYSIETAKYTHFNMVRLYALSLSFCFQSATTIWKSFQLIQRLECFHNKLLNTLVIER